MKKLLKPVFLIVFTVILITGCSQENNPLQPDPGNGGGEPDPDPIVINTPVQMHITEIRIAGFPEKKSNGDPWDYNPIFPLASRPDVVVELSIKSNDTRVYRSNTENDAYYLASYAFTAASSSGDPDLPYDASMTTKYKLEVWDKDVLADDIMTTYNFTPEDFYNQYNAENFSINATSGGVGIRIYGQWVY